MTDAERQEYLVELIRKHHPELFAKIQAMKADGVAVKVREDWKLEKFDGEWEPGKEPVEVIEGGDGRPTTITRKAVQDEG